MELYIPLKTSWEVAQIERSCRIAVKALNSLKKYISPGITTYELDRIADASIRQSKARPAVKKNFPGSICTSVNQTAAHGIPSKYRLKEGDLLTVDIAVSFDGWYGDAAMSFLVGQGDCHTENLLQAAWKVTLAGIKVVEAGACLGNVGSAVKKVADEHSCMVIEDCVGHGIGRKIHEEPVVPHIGKYGEGIRIVPGMVFTVEPALSLGSSKIELSDDGWSLVTSDNSQTAQFEHTVAVFKDFTEVLTLSQ